MSDVGRFRRRARPFDFITGAPQPGRYSPDDLDIQGAIEAIRFAPVEVGYGFDAEGRQVGDPSNIHGFDQRDLRAIAGGTFVHSHPPYLEFPEGDPRRRAGSFSLLNVERERRQRVLDGIIAVEEAECLGLIADETMARMSLFFDYRIREVRRDAS